MLTLPKVETTVFFTAVVRLPPKLFVDHSPGKFVHQLPQTAFVVQHIGLIGQGVDARVLIFGQGHKFIFGQHN